LQRLTEVGRSLEEQIPLRKTQYRLCRQLRRPGLWEHLTSTLCRMAASRIQELTLLILDISDVTKKYARRMEYLAGVHDGSEGRTATGYWTLQVVGAEPGPAILGEQPDKRYTFASQLAMLTGNLRAIQILLGHKSGRTTEAYSHLADRYLQTVVNQLPSPNLGTNAQ